MVLDENVLAAMDAKAAEQTDTFTLTELKAEYSVEFHHTQGFNPYFKVGDHSAKIQCGPSIGAALSAGETIESLEPKIFFTLCTFKDGEKGYKAALGSGESLKHEVVLF